MCIQDLKGSHWYLFSAGQILVPLALGHAMAAMAHRWSTSRALQDQDGAIKVQQRPLSWWGASMSHDVSILHMGTWTECGTIDTGRLDDMLVILESYLDLFVCWMFALIILVSCPSFDSLILSEKHQRPLGVVKHGELGTLPASHVWLPEAVKVG